MNYSVLMAVYKGDNPVHLRESIASMLNQSTMTNEFIIVTDGPIGEELQSVIYCFSEKNPGLFRQVNLDQNVGLGLALNAGLEVCTNEIVARMDADDISLETRCEKMLYEFMLDENLDIVGCNVDEFIGDPSNIIGTRAVPLSHDEIIKYARQRDPFNHPSVMFRLSKVLACGGYRDYRKNQDTDLWIRMILQGCLTKNIGLSLLLFRFDEKTYKKRKNWQNTKLLLKIRFDSLTKGFCTLQDFMMVLTAQMLIYIFPIGFQKWVYRNFLRESIH